MRKLTLRSGTQAQIAIEATGLCLLAAGFCKQFKSFEIPRADFAAGERFCRSARQSIACGGGKTLNFMQKCGLTILNLGLWLAASLAIPAAAQTLTLNPSSGPSGTIVTVTSSGFTAPFNTAFSINLQFVAGCPDTNTDERANCTVELRVPAVPSGTDVVEFTAFNSIGERATRNFTVTAPALAVRPSCAAPGLPVRVTGSGFAVGMSTAVFFNNSFTGASQVVPSSGQLDLSFVLPPVSDGRYSVVVADSTYLRATRDIDVAIACAPVGRVTELGGAPRAIGPDGTSRILTVGEQVFKGEVIETDSNSAIAVLFLDGTTLWLAEDSRLTIDEHVYDALTGKGRSFLDYLKGLFIYTSGLIGKDEPDNIQVDTPVGHLGIRGTEFISLINPVAGVAQHHLLTGTLAITPLSRSVPPEYNGPVTITANATGSSAVPLDPATYAAMKAQILGGLDSDGDGVRNRDDLCPGTAPGASVDARGCSLAQRDSDGDGVNDSVDQCPGTPTGAAVDANGCATSQLDADSDGVPNSLDVCPNTPAGSAVNSAGCATSQLDSDGDGVTDNLDICPGTAPGTPVDTRGCALPPPPSNKTCDVNGDKFVDYRDIGLILVAVGQRAKGASDPRDANSDGKIDRVDVAICTKKCDKSFCLPPK